MSGKVEELLPIWDTKMSKGRGIYKLSEAKVEMQQENREETPGPRMGGSNLDPTSSCSFCSYPEFCLFA